MPVLNLTPKDDLELLNKQRLQSKNQDNTLYNASIYRQINSIQRKSSKNKKDLKLIIKEYYTSREINIQEKKEFVRSVNEILLFGKIKLKNDLFVFIISLGEKILTKIEEHPNMAFLEIEKETCLINYIKNVLIMVLEGIWNLSVDKKNYEMHFARFFL